MRTSTLRSFSPELRATVWLCAAALFLMLVPAHAQAPAAAESPRAPEPARHADSIAASSHVADTDAGDDPEPAPAPEGDDAVSLEACACELAAGDGGCRSECNQSVNGPSEPNYCEGAKPSQECWQCVKQKCGVDLPR